MPWYEPILRSAGACPIVESSKPTSPCRPLLEPGLSQQMDEAHKPVRWVTAAGWGNADADLYIVGTTPKFHTAAVPGPNYARVDVDRADHALWFSTAGFGQFQESQSANLRETTRWSIALVRAWNSGAVRVSDAAFFTELMLCPQELDPSLSRSGRAYRQCMGRHLLHLLELRPGVPPTMVLLGKKVAEALYVGAGIEGPVPSRSQPVVVRRPDGAFPVPLIASQAVMGVKMAGLSQAAWVNQIIQLRERR